MVFKAQIREMEQQNLYQNTASGPLHLPVVPIPSPSTSSMTLFGESNPNCNSTSTTAPSTPFFLQWKTLQVLQERRQYIFLCNILHMYVFHVPN